MKYRLAVFDMDGTILDTLDDLTDSLNHVLDIFCMPRRTRREVRSFMGNGIRRLIELGVPSGTPEDITDKVYLSFSDYYPDHCAIRTGPYPGILSLIDTLRRHGMQTAVVSNKVDCAVQLLCAQYFPDAFDAVAGEQPGIRRKPCPDAVNHVLSVLGIPREEAVYLGDTEVDIRTAVNAGMDCIAVDWGFRDRSFLQGLHPTFLISSPEEAVRILLGCESVQTQ